MRGFLGGALFLLTRVNLNHNSRLKNNNLRTSEAYIVPLPANMPARLQTCQHMSFSEHAHTYGSARLALRYFPSLPFPPLSSPRASPPRVATVAEIGVFFSICVTWLPLPLFPRPSLPYRGLPLSSGHFDKLALSSSSSFVAQLAY